ncbi:MAG: hypothetical protein J6O04_10460 [Selenomonadaceae bacterium]|nr:hypothetical protein [Selenomonadaceae bacterium]
MKKVVALVLLLAMPVVAMAHGQLWYDKKSYVARYKKVIVYPLGWINSDKLFYDDDESSNAYKMNDYLDKKLAKRFKTVSLGRILRENKDVRTDEERYKPLYEAFKDEESRSKQIREIDAGANGYLMPYFTENRDEPHLSPAAYVNVRMTSYTEETGGPNGNKIYDRQNWTERVLIPQMQRNLHHMGLEFILYDENGKKALTFKNEAHEYDDSRMRRTEFSMYKDLVDEFESDLKEMVKKRDAEDYEERTGKKIGFKIVTMPENVSSNDTLAKSIYYTVKSRAERIGKARVLYGNDDLADYFVEGNIAKYALEREWRPPRASTYTSLKSHRTRKWRDRRGKEHTMHIRRYETKVSTYPGEWVYTAKVYGRFNLVDARTGKVIVSHEAMEEDDKTGDALIHLMDNFYSKVKRAVYDD